MLNVDELLEFNVQEKLSISTEEESDYDEILYSENQIVIIKRFDNNESFNAKWKETVHFTAGYIQNKLENLGFSQDVAWDIYIVFLINFEAGHTLVSSIEKDKYCCKKYVIDTRGYSGDKAAISSRIPLFAHMELKDYSSAVCLNDTEIKLKITEGDCSIAAVIFENIDFIDDPSQCDELLLKLKELYINEQIKND